ncbi:unnamed protein product [Tetraodon nigroviridis]|uniref:Chromosome 7 SCAF15042, whole genome shotgun sequence n=1 Tax=Tetraodon nigroviridis TaxID=99883 RepID=Q4RIR0_TETNG|nr:unnamed protein product [Tetraodon nigroviridis]
MHHNGTQDFVECLSNLTEGPQMCKRPFFCKVHDILENRKNKKTPEKNHEMKILRDLERYLDFHNVTCSRVLKNVTTSTTTELMPQFWEKVERCIQHHNTQKQ